MSIHTDGKDVKSHWSLTAYNTQIRPQNIGNIHPPRCKKKSDATMERMNSNLMADVVENIGLKAFSFTQIIQMDYQFDQTYDCFTIESNVLHQFESYLQRLFCTNICCSLRKNRLYRNFNPMFSTTSARSQSPPIAIPISALKKYKRINCMQFNNSIPLNICTECLKCGKLMVN